MKILLLGKNGQLGWELQRSLSTIGTLVSVSSREVDFENPDLIRHCIKQNNPNVIVNAAAYTAVDKAESEPEKAFRINSEAVNVLASEAKKTNAWLIHYSTDYVYDGRKSIPYNENDKFSPKSIYGKSKLQGEQEIINTHEKHLIFRTSWVYGFHGHNFVKTILKLAKEKHELRIVSDQYGTPTSADLIADITALALFKIKETKEDKYWGSYNLVPSGDTNWFEFAQLIVRQAQQLMSNKFKIGPGQIQPISTEEYPLPAFRPCNSRLDNTKLSNSFNVNLPSWDYHARRVINEILKEAIS